MGLLGAFLAGVPVRVNTRHHASMNHGTSFYWLDRLTNLLANRIIATSELLRRVLMREKADPEKVRLVRLGIDTDRFRQVPESEVRQLAARYNPSGASPVVGVIARHIELKGVQYIVPAFRKLLETYPDAYLILGYATGPYHAAIEEKLAGIPGTASARSSSRRTSSPSTACSTCSYTPRSARRRSRSASPTWRPWPPGCHRSSRSPGWRGLPGAPAERLDRAAPRQRQDP